MADLSLIFETLNKIASRTGKIRFLEDAMFNEPEENRMDLLKLIKNLKGEGDKTSIEGRIEQQLKETKDAIVDEVDIPAAPSKPKSPGHILSQTSNMRDLEAELRRLPTPGLETIETVAEEVAVPRTLPDEAPAQGAYSALTQEKASSYRHASEAPGYLRNETPGWNAMPAMNLTKEDEEKLQPEEEYKRTGIFRLGMETKQKQEAYRRRESLRL